MEASIMNGNSMAHRFIVFGGTGDLTYRKLMPAFYNLLVSGSLKEEDEIVVIGRRAWTKQDYVNSMKAWVQEFARLSFTEDHFAQLVDRLSYVKMDLSNVDDYYLLASFVQSRPAAIHVCYMAVAPQYFETIVDGIHSIGLANVRLVMEKPFGTDLASATALQKKVVHYFSSENVYRIDHYLGKDMVRNILTIRCENPMFEAVWNHQYIDHINIYATEEVGVGNRGAYYDGAGALRDMAQNHLLQLLSIIAVDNPHDLSTMPFQQSLVLHSLKLGKEPMVMGQYRGYLSEKDVPQDSKTETFAKFTAYVNTTRFQGVPFHIVTGKALAHRETAIQIVFKAPISGQKPNILTIQVQPKEGVDISFNIKTPGKDGEVSMVNMDFCQNCQMKNRLNTPEAYEWMLKSITQEDGSWFSHWDQIVTSWHFMDALMEKRPDPLPYEVGSWGPDGGVSEEIQAQIEKPFVCPI